MPALTGLGSPHWDADARGLISGLTRGTTRAHLVRAALEGMAHQVADIVDVLPVEAGVLRADGGATANGFLMQLQADLIGVPGRGERPTPTRRRSGPRRSPGSPSASGRTSSALVPLLRRGNALRAVARAPATIEQAARDWRQACPPGDAAR